jgi:ADP-ribosyl-[dinitrogen reductase] hydrolase
VPDAGGNGGIMRLAPVAIRYWSQPDAELFALAEESSRATHAGGVCCTAAGCLAIILSRLIRGAEKEEALAAGLWKSRLHPLIAQVAAGSYRHKQPPEIRGSGYVVNSLEAALWAFAGASSFREAVLRAVNLGEDSDSTGAVCGQLAGACWGEEAIPAEWKEGLARKEMIEEALDGLPTTGDR